MTVIIEILCVAQIPISTALFTLFVVVLLANVIVVSPSSTTDCHFYRKITANCAGKKREKKTKQMCFLLGDTHDEERINIELKNILNVDLTADSAMKDQLNEAAAEQQAPSFEDHEFANNPNGNCLHDSTKGKYTLT